MEDCPQQGSARQRETIIGVKSRKKGGVFLIRFLFRLNSLVSIFILLENMKFQRRNILKNTIFK